MTAGSARAASGAVRRDAAVALVGLLLLIAWDASGVDLALTRWYGGRDGFAWRDAWLTGSLLHVGGRWLAGLAIVLLAIDCARPLLTGPPRRERARGLALTLAALLFVPALKRASRTSCPWSLAEFGGSAPYVPHFVLGLADGGPGHCFPSGHAVAAFAFFGVYFTWRAARPAAARRWLAGVCAVGLLFGWTQLARGAHFASHTLWSAWLCWSFGATLAAPWHRLVPTAVPAMPRRRRPAGGLAGRGR